ncbi:hypothetical protein BC831DRAFT_457828 [Entophlyctis helioformis]|nr:hypothetical protein BC831DRAFT_457828 [Entophlyctis helioformis]
MCGVISRSISRQASRGMRATASTSMCSPPARPPTNASAKCVTRSRRSLHPSPRIASANSALRIKCVARPMSTTSAQTLAITPSVRGDRPSVMRSVNSRTPGHSRTSSARLCSSIEQPRRLAPLDRDSEVRHAVAAVSVMAPTSDDDADRVKRNESVSVMASERSWPPFNRRNTRNGPIKCSKGSPTLAGTVSWSCCCRVRLSRKR